MQIKRHVGKINPTGQKVIVVFRNIPTGENSPPDRDHCLIVQTSRLSELHHDNLMQIVDGNEAQQTIDLYKVLERMIFADGGNVLATLHHKGYLTKVRVDDVTLYPFPNQALSLRDANNAIDGTTAQKTETNATVQTNNTEASADEKLQIAANLVAQAELLEAEAVKKREEAYLLDPSLRPAKGRPELSPEERSRRKVERNERRRERYQENKSKA